MIDPFLGGGSVPLSAITEGLVDRLDLMEIDEDVAAVWKCVFSDDYEKLCRRILEFRISRGGVLRELEKCANTPIRRAFRTILKNRTYRGGILAGGASLMNAGEGGRGVASRWYPKTLARRIRLIAQFRSAVAFDCGNGLDLIEAHKTNERAVFFLDPPYTAGQGKRAGTRLYAHSQLDHERLFRLMANCSAPFLMTYDDDPTVEALARNFGFYVQRVPMKNTHHECKFELAITRMG